MLFRAPGGSPAGISSSRRYFLPKYRWRLVVSLDVLLTACYISIWWRSFPILGFVIFTTVMGAISAALLLVERHLSGSRRLNRRTVEDTFG